MSDILLGAVMNVDPGLPSVLLRDQPLANQGRCQPRWAEGEGMDRRVDYSQALNITLLEV